MSTLAVIADDLTGALDTGVKFAKQGISTKIVIYTGAPFVAENEDATVVVVCATTRHLPAEEAYRMVYQVTEEIVAHNIPYLYKKTDSVLRGNIGSELDAVLEASGCGVIPYVPAFPVMGRTTRDGVQLLHGTPIAESILGRDPLNPVRESDVGKVILEQSKYAVSYGTKNNITEPLPTGMLVVDGETEDDLDEVATQLEGLQRLKVTAGCAGFASALEKRLSLPRKLREESKRTPGVIIGCGTINPVTMAQVAYGVKQGFVYFDLTAIQRCKTMEELTSECLALVEQIWEEYRAGKSVIFTTRVVTEEDIALGSARCQEDQLCRVEQIIAIIVEKLFQKKVSCPIFIIGGDTISALLAHIHVGGLSPICELADGVVETEITYEGTAHSVISKSGGFGAEDLFQTLFM